MASARALLQAKADPNADALVKAVAGEFETSEGRGLAQDGVKTAISGAKASTETTQMRYATQDKDGAKEGALFWADRGVGYVVTGTSDRDRLTQVARQVYDQSDKSGG